MNRHLQTSNSNILLFLTLGLALVALGISIYQYTQQPKIAFIESNVLIGEYSESKQARDKLNAKIQEWQTNVDTLQSELEALNSELVDKAENWSTSERETHLGKMQQKQQEFSRYSNAVNQKASELETELMEPVYTSINNRVKVYSKEHGYEIVFGTIQGGNILYGSEAVNVTWDFIRYLESDE